MTEEYTEMIENQHPDYMRNAWEDHAKKLERELRKARVKIAELEVKIKMQEKPIEETSSR